MRKNLQRGLCLILCVVMAFSCLTVSVGAVTPAISALVPFLKDAVANWLIGAAADATLQTFKDWVDGKTTDPTGYIAPIGALRTAQKTEVTEDRLRELAYEWNITCSEAVGFTVDVVDHRLDTGEVYRIIAVRRGYVVTTAATQWCLADGMQRILYCDATTELSGRWSPEDQTSGRHLLDYNALFNLSQDVGGQIRLKDNFYEIYTRDGQGMSLYCNVAGRRFSCIYKPDQTAVNQDRPTTGGTVIEGDTITNIENNDNSVTNDCYQDIDIGSMTHVLPGGTLNEIDNLIYDDNTKTYYVDSHDVTNNITQNYLYEYHINYTSITYIGQTEEYNKRYELYYQLPDGRSSADLTVEDLEQLSTSFKDVVNYARSADDLNQRALYHFDGDTQDSSYWSYCSSFDWAKGASITYMDEGAFGGSLYLDETEHDFTLTLPANDAAGDFTLQFRYYQSHTETPQLDSFLSIGGTTLLQFDGASYYDASGAVIAATSIGSWNELCLMRKDGVLHYYINGVPYGSMSLPIGTSAVRFYFGADQQTYKKLDELRFTRGAIYEAGKGYTPTSVPYDSNLSLVLPFGTVPMADEVMIFKPSANNLFSAASLADWTKSAAVGAVKPYVSATGFETAYSRYQSVGVSLYRNPSYTTVRHDGDSTLLSTAGITGLEITESGNPERSDLANGLYLPVCTTERHFDVSAGGAYYSGHTLYTPGQDYTLSVLLSDGSYSYLTYRVAAHADSTGTYYSVSVVDQELSSVVHIDACDMEYWTEITNDNRFDYEDTYRITNYGFRLCPSSAGTTADIIYMELVKGSVPEFAVSWEGAVYDPGTLTESPVLAVRSNTDITTYQIGGVRPSYPEKGQVYAMVESGYIISLQQYTGSVWEAVDGRIWTGQRWIPASSYNVITLQDMWDIVDATEDFEYIYTESGFWSWLQKAWKDMLQRLDTIIELLGGGSGGDCQHVYDSEFDDEPNCTDPGHVIYTCSLCGHTYSGLVDPLGHDWVVTDHVDPTPLQASYSSAPVMYATRPGPTITQQPVSGTTTEGGSALTFTVKAEGAAPLTYQWQYLNNDTWTNVPGNSTDSSLGLGAYAYRNGWQLRCLVTDANGNITISSVATMTVKSPITMTSQPQDQELYKNEIAEFSITAEGTGLQYQWEYSTDGSTWASIPGISTSSYVRLTVTDARNGWMVRCVITDANGYSVVSDVASLTMKPPIVITTQPESQEILKGEIAKFVVEAEGTGLKYQWQYRINNNAWSSIPGNSTDSDVRLTGFDYRNGWQIRCLITDADGNSVVTDVVTLSVYAAHGYDILTCSRCGATAEDHGNGVVISGGSPDKTFSIDNLILDSFSGVWSVVVSVIDSGFGGLGGFVEGFSLLPDFFALYKPQGSILGVMNYREADIWD